MKKSSKGKMKKQARNQQKEPRNYLLMFLVAMVGLFVLTLFITQSGQQAKVDTPEAKFELSSHPKLEEFYAYEEERDNNQSEYLTDQAMVERESWTEVACWSSNDQLQYSEDTTKYSDMVQLYTTDSPGYINELTGQDCLDAYAHRREILLGEWLTAISGQINIDLQTPGLRGYYQDNPSELERDQQMVERETFDGFCWVNEEHLIYQEFPQQFFQIELQRKFGDECLQFYTERRNKLFKSWQEDQPNS